MSLTSASTGIPFPRSFLPGPATLTRPVLRAPAVSLYAHSTLRWNFVAAWCVVTSCPSKTVLSDKFLRDTDCNTRECRTCSIQPSEYSRKLSLPRLCHPSRPLALSPPPPLQHLAVKTRTRSSLSSNILAVSGCGGRNRKHLEASPGF